MMDEVEIGPEGAKSLNFKKVVHKKCGKPHIDGGEFSKFNHRKHLCHYCNEYFYDGERGVGI
jgi:hypothetical protein